MRTDTVPGVDPLRLLRYVPASAERVLDCACGDGALGAAVKQARPRFVAGIERVSALAEMARGALDTVLCGDQYSCALPGEDGSFDCAVCELLLPQLRDPAPFLARLVAKLRPGGLLVATAPNIQFHEHFLMLARGRWRHSPGTALDRRFIRFFTAYELLGLLQRAGFAQVRCGMLDSVGPECFPLGADGYVRFEDLEVGPMDAEQHKGFLAREYIVLAVKPG